LVDPLLQVLTGGSITLEPPAFFCFQHKTPNSKEMSPSWGRRRLLETGQCQAGVNPSLAKSRKGRNLSKTTFPAPKPPRETAEFEQSATRWGRSPSDVPRAEEIQRDFGDSILYRELVRNKPPHPAPIPHRRGSLCFNFPIET